MNGELKEEQTKRETDSSLKWRVGLREGRTKGKADFEKNELSLDTTRCKIAYHLIFTRVQKSLMDFLITYFFFLIVWGVTVCLKKK